MPLDTVKQTIKFAQSQLNTHLNLTAFESIFEAQFLLQYALNKDRAWLIAHENEIFDSSIKEAFEGLLNRRLAGEPIAYIVGYREFYGLHLKVTSDTLVPRPDTETLVEAALAKMPLHTSQAANTHIQSVLDLGTGSGAIALAIAKNRPLSNITAIDASQAALNVAIENASNLFINNVQFKFSNWFSAVSAIKFDLIVSNPPYIEADDTHLKQGDLRFEPLNALTSGLDGLDDIRQIIYNAPQYLNTNGWLMLEHGYNQAEQVAELLKQAGFSEISHVLDLSGTKRVTVGRLNVLATS
ncbi:MAG: peptide chain release factor N(5)-glutamine methyltransferase [Pseudomonadota bacterium]